MIVQKKEKFIRQKANDHTPEDNEKIFWSFHAVQKLRIEGLRKKDIENSLKECIIIEDYIMETRPLPGCLVLGFIDTIPVHIVIAIDSECDRIFIVTVYKPSSERWKDDWKRRNR